MAASSTEICNKALFHLAHSKRIANLDTEQSNEALACRTFFADARDQCLRDFPWPFATKFATLGLVEEDPTEEWTYSYRYPTDCLEFRRILSGSRNDTRDTRVPCRIGQDDDGLLIYTDMEEATAEYTVRVTAAVRFPVDFVLALSYLLASFIAPSVTNGDPGKLGARAYELYLLTISRAQANALNEQQPDQVPESEFIRERG